MCRAAGWACWPAVPTCAAAPGRPLPGTPSCNGPSSRRWPGAELAYITCTLHPLENEQAVDWLLAEDSGLERLVQWQTPHDHPWLEGMFAARLRRRG